MKSLLSFTVLFFTIFIAPDASAQWESGVCGGISIPNLTAPGSENNPLNTGYSSRLGPDFGVFAERHIMGKFSLEARIEYSSQGGKKDGLQA